MKESNQESDRATAKKQQALERKFWRYFLLIKTAILVIIFTLLAIAVWRFLKILKGM